MEEPNVNKLNGVPNFGHGFQEEQVEDLQNLSDEVVSEQTNYEEGKENVTNTEGAEEKDNG